MKRRAASFAFAVWLATSCPARGPAGRTNQEALVAAARNCGVPDLMVISTNKEATQFDITETNFAGMFLGPPTFEERKEIQRQALIESRLPCIRSAASELGLTVTFSVNVIVN